MMNRDITFCVPCHNSSATMARCLRAVLSEQRENPGSEIVVVDNASTDGTAEIALGMFAGVPNTRVVVNERNVGRIENWNRCVKEAAGDWLRFATTNNFLPVGSTAALRKSAGTDCGFVFGKVSRVEELPAVAPRTQDGEGRDLKRRGMLAELACLGNSPETLDSALLNAARIRDGRVQFNPGVPYFADFLFLINLADQAPGCAIISGLTAVMDMGLKQRYAFVGTREESYYLQGRVCALRLGELLGDHHLAFWFLDKQFYRDCGGRPPSLEKTREIFRGSGHLIPYAHWLLSRVREQRN